MNFTVISATKTLSLETVLSFKYFIERPYSRDSRTGDLFMEWKRNNMYWTLNVSHKTKAQKLSDSHQFWSKTRSGTQISCLQSIALSMRPRTICWLPKLECWDITCPGQRWKWLATSFLSVGAPCKLQLQMGKSLPSSLPSDRASMLETGLYLERPYVCWMSPSWNS